MPAVPHVLPYQGSKRALSERILAHAGKKQYARLFEPFAGSAALTLAAASRSLCSSYVLADALPSLADLWLWVVECPTLLADGYESVWKSAEQAASYYADVRAGYNAGPDPSRLLYLLARCVKNSPRWNQAGQFNQSEDKRRLGTHPSKVRKEILAAHALLAGKTAVYACDFEVCLAGATTEDLVYLDPPWQGTSGNKDTRYYSGLARERLVACLESLNNRRVSWLLSYDGRCGDKTYGELLPSSLCNLVELEAGRSTQATLNGESSVTFESLYISLF